jgi:hypothetical protein
VQGSENDRIVGRVAQLGAVGAKAEHDVEPFGVGLEGRQTRHLGSVDPRRVGELAPGEGGCLVAQMLLDQLHLTSIRGIVGDHGLQPTLRRRLEVVSGRGEIEGHDVGAAFGDELLAARIRCRGQATDRNAGNCDAGGDQHERDPNRPPSQER